MPSGTLGGRKHPTRTPCARSSAAVQGRSLGPRVRRARGLLPRSRQGPRRQPGRGQGGRENPHRTSQGRPRRHRAPPRGAGLPRARPDLRRRPLRAPSASRPPARPAASPGSPPRPAPADPWPRTPPPGGCVATPIKSSAASDVYKRRGGSWVAVMRASPVGGARPRVGLTRGTLTVFIEQCSGAGGHDPDVSARAGPEGPARAEAAPRTSSSPRGCRGRRQRAPRRADRPRPPGRRRRRSRSAPAPE